MATRLSDNCHRRLLSEVLKGIDLATGDYSLRAVFADGVGQQFTVVAAPSISINQVDFSNALSVVQNVAKGTQVMTSFKSFVGGATHSTSFNHVFTCKLDQLNLSITVGSTLARATTVPNVLTAECDRARAGVQGNYDNAMAFIESFGTHYVHEFNAGGLLHIFIGEETSSHSSASTSHTAAKVSLADFLSLSNANSVCQQQKLDTFQRQYSLSAVGGLDSTLGFLHSQEDKEQWIRNVSQNSVIISRILKPISGIFTEARDKFAIEHACETRFFDALGGSAIVCARRGLNLLPGMFESVVCHADRVLGCGLNCGGCDCSDQGYSYRATLTRLSSQFQETIGTLLESHDIVQGVERYAPALKATVNALAQFVGSQNAPPNAGVFHKRPSPCCHYTSFPGNRNAVTSECSPILEVIDEMSQAASRFLRLPPSWFEPFHDHKNFLIVGPTNSGKGSMINYFLNTVGLPQNVTMEVNETTEPVKHYPVGERCTLHDPPGCGSARYPLNASYLQQSGIAFMTASAVICPLNAAQPMIVCELIQAMRNRHIRGCIILSKGDTVFQPGMTQHQAVALSRQPWDTLAGGMPVFVTSIVPEFLDAAWNQINEVVDFFLTG
eukprot:TRINITY_DN7364_c0_g1_i1.p1 TRINITY_DN7364_c0_g1~~TRINITY_DN7364_c0_g1_i1.p1  ORF type:complete len:630 (-),score=117.95 TRINITY_DN7364_c0_g1_i1:130-1965(-)